MDACRNCDAPVTRAFTRVYGDENDVLHACPACTTLQALRDGAGAGLEPVLVDAPDATREADSALTDGADRGDPAPSKQA